MKRIPGLLLLLPFASACGTDVSGPSSSLLSCVFGAGTTLAVGEVLQVRGAGNQSLCFTAGELDEELVFIPFYGVASSTDDEPAATLSVEVTGGGFQPATTADPGTQAGAFAIGSATTRRERDAGFHRRLRQREVEELEPRIRGVAPNDPRVGYAPAVPRSVSAAVPMAGDLLDLNVAISCESQDVRTGRVEYVSQQAIVVADTANPAGLVAADFRHFGEIFDTLVYPLGAAHFGDPTDIDANGRAIIFFTRAVNELTPAESETFTAGFFWSGDLFPETSTPRLQACPAANQGEMFYVLTADPAGVVGLTWTADQIRRLAVGVIAHEFQHLINAGRRLYVNNANAFERPWLNEGLSHIAEELMFYAVSGLQPGHDLTVEDIRAAPGGVDAFNEFMGSNFTNYRQYLERPDTASLMGIDELSTRGATWSFLRYAADRSGRGDAGFFQEVVNDTDTGLDNLDAAIGRTGGALDWMQDWTVSVFADDLVPGLDARYAQRSWDMRSIYEGSSVGEYPLHTPGLSSGTVFSVDLLPGGSAYPRFGVAADGRAAVHVESDGRAPPRSLRGSFVRIQ